MPEQSKETPDYLQKWEALKKVKTKPFLLMLENRGLRIRRSQFDQLVGGTESVAQGVFHIKELYELLEVWTYSKQEMDKDFLVYTFSPNDEHEGEMIIIKRANQWPIEVAERLIKLSGCNRNEFIESYCHEYLI